MWDINSRQPIDFAVPSRELTNKNTHVLKEHTCVLLNTNVFLFGNSLVYIQLYITSVQLASELGEITFSTSKRVPDVDNQDD